MTTPTKTEEVKKEEKRKPLPIVSFTGHAMGCDPEFFFRDATTKRIIGAEKVLPKAGLEVGYGGSSGKVVIDGVQAELNPGPYACRANHANNIASLFRALDVEIKEKKLNVVVDLSRSVTITKTELKKLDPNNQRFGCLPSFSFYKGIQGDLALVNPLIYRHRSAGGHIHIGCGEGVHKTPEDLVKMMDIIVGNTCVLIDRDKGNARRRKLYGRAGEYRLPKHGLEYRTLSNFWLTSYPLMSMVFGLTRLVTSLVFCTPAASKRYIEEFMSKVNMDDIQKAINTNNFKLALKNFRTIEPLLMEVLPENGDTFGLNRILMKEFHYFIETVKKDGLTHWFKEDPFQHWIKLPEAHGDGFTNFLITKVRPELNKLEKKLA